MLEYVRKHNKIMMILLFLLIIPSFILVGIDGYNRFLARDKTVARVGKSEIVNGEWDAAHRQEVERIRQIMPTLDAKLLDSDAARYGTLERLVRDRVLEQTAQAQRLSVSDARLAQELQGIPAIAQLRRPDGSLDIARYRELLASQGLSPEAFESRVRAELAVRQVQGVITQTALMPQVVADEALSSWHERREVQLARFTPADYVARVQPTPADLDAYYKEHTSEFQAPEQADIDYLVLDIDAVRKGIKLNDADVRSYYEQNVARLSGPEERRASHILIAVAKDAPADVRAKARQRAEDLLAQLRKDPSQFASLARKNSDDPGSAAKGGDLDYFGRGAMVKPFEDAAFALEKGELSGIVESDFGFHIIQLTDIKAPRTKTFEELRAGLEDELRTQQARAKFAEAAETFTNGVYEQSDSLQPVATKLGLSIQKAQGVLRQAQAGAKGPLASGKFLEAVFNSDSIANKRNTEAVEVGPSLLAAAHVTQYHPARTLALDEVRDRVRERVVQARAAEMARQEGEQKFKAWQAAPDTAHLGTALTVSRDQAQGLGANVLNAILRADPAHLPQWVGVDLGSQGYVVARVVQKLPPAEVAADAKRQQRGQYAQWWTQAEGQAYYELLRDRLKVEIKVPKPAAAPGS